MSPRVSFLPGGESVEVDRGTAVLVAARTAGVQLVASCGGRGTCGSCAVRVHEGALGEPDDVEFTAMARLPKSVRLACRATVVGDVTVEPIMKPKRVEPAQPLAVPASTASLHLLDDDDYALPADVLGRGTSEETRFPAALVVGVDLGTTNVSAAVVNPDTGQVVGTATVPNRQTSWGADVLTRLSASLGGDAVPLRNAAQMSVVDAVEQALATGGSHGAHIDRVVIAANSVMAALLVGADASTLAAAPFVPVTQLELTDGPFPRKFPAATVQVLQPIAAFVGGDTRAGLVATGMSVPSEQPGNATPTLFIDIGTNAEVALRVGSTVWVASAPAGSAFEGVGAYDLRVPGSTLLRALHQAREAGSLDETGLLQEGRDNVSRSTEGILQLRTEAGATITQLNVRDLQMAKSAVRAATNGVLREAGVSPGDLGDVFVAGAFGGAVPAEVLIGLGVVPPVGADVITFAGNASVDGALAVAKGQSSEVVGTVLHVDLATDPSFSSDLMSYTALRSH